MIGKTDSKSTSGQGSEGNEKHSIRNWKKEKSCHVVAEGLAELYPTVIWKAELVNDELALFFWGDSKPNG